MTQALKLAEELCELDVDPIKNDGKKRRAKSFPSGTQLAFIENPDPPMKQSSIF